MKILKYLSLTFVFSFVSVFIPANHFLNSLVPQSIPFNSLIKSSVAIYFSSIWATAITIEVNELAVELSFQHRPPQNGEGFVLGLIASFPVLIVLPLLPRLFS